MIFLVVLVMTIASVFAGEQHVAVNQDSLGNYKLKYAIDGISRVEHGDQFGNVNGGFSYIDPYGILRKTEFTSGVHGYNAVGTDIPIPVQDTPEVAHAKAKHLSVLHAESLRPKILEFQGPEENFIAPFSSFGHVAPAPVHFAPAPFHFAPAPHHVTAAPLHFAPTPLHLTHAPLHFAPGHLQFAQAPVHFASAPVQVAPAPLHFAPAQTHFNAHHVPQFHGFSHLGISETPEVLAARAEHFAAHAAVLKSHFHH